MVAGQLITSKTKLSYTSPEFHDRRLGVLHRQGAQPHEPARVVLHFVGHVVCTQQHSAALPNMSERWAGAVTVEELGPLYSLLGGEVVIEKHRHSGEHLNLCSWGAHGAMIMPARRPRVRRTVLI